jgi:uncharacterized protein (TIGR03083 family)
VILTDAELIEWVQESADRASRVASEVHADTAIPSCPGWTMMDLIGHVAPLFAGFYSYNLRQPPGEGDFLGAMQSARPLPDGFADRIAYLRESCAEFISLARQVDLDGPVWAFWTTQPARFWLERAATELAIHTWDAETAVGEPARLAPDRAATGVGESLRSQWLAAVELRRHGMVPDAPTPPEKPAGFSATDADHHWHIRTIDGVVEVDESRGLLADVGSGSGHDLLLYLTGRAAHGQGTMEVIGDRSTIDAWRLPF